EEVLGGVDRVRNGRRAYGHAAHGKGAAQGEGGIAVCPGPGPYGARREQLEEAGRREGGRDRGRLHLEGYRQEERGGGGGRDVETVPDPAVDGKRVLVTAPDDSGVIAGPEDQPQVPQRRRQRRRHRCRESARAAASDPQVEVGRKRQG